jgi:hypothetical protein
MYVKGDDGGQRDLESALSIYESLPTSEADIKIGHGYAELFLADLVAKGDRKLDRAVALFLDVGHTCGQVQCMLARARRWCTEKRWTDAAGSYEVVISMYTDSRHTDLYDVFAACTGAAWCYTELLRYDDGRRVAQGAVAAARELCDKNGEADALDLLGDCCGEGVARLEHWIRAQELYKEFGDDVSVRGVLERHGLCGFFI